MSLGFDSTLFVLAFDHRGSFERDLLKLSPGSMSHKQQERIVDLKHVIFEGMLRAVEQGAPVSSCGALVDEQYGGDVPTEVRERGLKLAMPVERSGVKVFEFAYGNEFGAHIERFRPDFAKVLVRYNPDGDAHDNVVQRQRLRQLSDWLHAREIRFLFELLVPATITQLAAVDGDKYAYDTRLRPMLMVRAIKEMQDAGIEPDVWKIEGLDTREDCTMVADTCTSGGREHVSCVVLGRGADDARVEHWLRQAAGVPGFRGFAVGRSIWSEALGELIEGSMTRQQAIEHIAFKYLRFIHVYEQAQSGVAV